jgi:hypothetical protein
VPPEAYNGNQYSWERHLKLHVDIVQVARDVVRFLICLLALALLLIDTTVTHKA